VTAEMPPPQESLLPHATPSAADISNSSKNTAPGEALEAEIAAESGPGDGSTTKSRTASSKDLDDPIPGFSNAASGVYFAQVNRYIVDLERFSRFKAKADSLETVSRQHVTQAASFLSSLRAVSKKSHYCETSGGILLGAGISELITLVQSNKFSGPLVIITAVLIALGGVLIGMFLGRD
jgi:hypothetical protein